MSVSQISHINLFEKENKLVEICNDLRNSNSDYSKIFEKFAELPAEVKNKIFYYQWKVLDKNSQTDRFGEFAFLNIENQSCSNLEKIDAIEKFLIHSVKKQLAIIAKDFEQDKEMEAHSKLSQVCAFSQNIEILKDLENDLYFQMWKVIDKPSNKPQIGELTFKRAGGNWEKSRAVNNYIEVLPLLSSFTSSEKTDALCLNIIREKASIEIQGSKFFRKFVAANIKKLLKCDIGRELFSYIEMRSNHDSIRIVHGESAQLQRIIDSPNYTLEFPLENDLDSFCNSEDNEIEVCALLPHTTLAHELAHYHLKSNDNRFNKEPSTNPLHFPHLEEEIVITGIMKNGEKYKFSENEFRKKFNYPMRISHQCFSKRNSLSPLTKSCFMGSFKNTENYLKQGFNVNIKETNNDSTPLHHLCSSPFSLENVNNCKNIIDLLLQNGADIHNKTKEGFSPIFLLGHTIIKLIKNKIIDRNKVNGMFEIYKHLISKGANPFALEGNFSSIDELLRNNLRELNEDDLILQLNYC